MSRAAKSVRSAGADDRFRISGCLASRTNAPVAWETPSAVGVVATKSGALSQRAASAGEAVKLRVLRGVFPMSEANSACNIRAGAVEVLCAQRVKACRVVISFKRSGGIPVTKRVMKGRMSAAAPAESGAASKQFLRWPKAAGSDRGAVPRVRGASNVRNRRCSQRISRCSESGAARTTVPWAAASALFHAVRWASGHSA